MIEARRKVKEMLGARKRHSLEVQRQKEKKNEADENKDNDEDCDGSDNNDGDVNINNDSKVPGYKSEYQDLDKLGNIDEE